MAVVATVRVTKGSSASGKYGESDQFSETWKVRVDDPATSKSAILSAAGIYYGLQHPDSSSALAMEYDISDDDESGLWWKVTWKFYKPPKENTPDPDNHIPKDNWTATGTTTSGPAWKDKDGVMMTNSAGDPLEDLEREYNEFGWTLTKNYLNTGWVATALACSNAVNSATWGGGAVRTWKCVFRGAQQKTFAWSNGTTSYDISYWETQWEFQYRSEKWDLQPWDIGFNQLVDSSGTATASGNKRAAVLGADKKAVRQPVALSSGIAKPAGQKPDALEFHVYQEKAFATYFGNPPA
jgi:hypothetical protein